MMQEWILALKVPLESLNSGKLNISSPVTKTCVACGQPSWLLSKRGRCWVAAWRSRRPEGLQAKINSALSSGLIGMLLTDNLKESLQGKNSPQTKKLTRSVS